MTSVLAAQPVLAPGPSGPLRITVRRLAPPEPLIEPAEQPPAPQPARDPDPGQAPPPGLRGARVEVSTVLRMILEVLDGRRASAQLSSRLSPPVLRYLGALAGRLDAPTGQRARSGRRPPALRSLRLSQPAAEIAEASAVWRYNGRHRALAARFEWSTDHWHCTALRLG